MALDFGRVEFPVSFNPTSAFPLDARTYFESLTSAQAAAASAAVVGSADSAYYIGQTLVVVENGLATFYIIQTDRTLTPVGDRIKVDTKLFEYDDEGNLSLKGFDEAGLNSSLVKNADGTITWKVFDVYSKSETDAKINEAVTAAAHLKRKIVNSIEEIDIDADDAENYIYMVPTGFELESDKYDEYIVIVIADSRVIEKVGSWDVSLDDYAKTSDVEAALDNKVDKQEGYSLISSELLNKLMGIENNAQENYIQSVSSQFVVEVLNGQRQLQLDVLPISQIQQLQEILDNKYDKSEGTLLTASDRAKLDKLVINESNENLEISGIVNVTKVEGLEEWLQNWTATNASHQEGLSENNLTDELKSKLDSLLEITSVTEELSLNAGVLGISKIDISKVTNLNEALALKATQTEVNQQISTLSDALNDMARQHNADIEEIWDTLTWKNII